MSETLKQRLSRLTKELAGRRKYNRGARKRRDALNKRIGAVNRRIRELVAGVKKTKAQLSRPRGAQAAIKWALDQVGTTENPYGSNSGPKISDWIRAGGGVPGWAWCQYFANVVATKGGAPQLKTGYTVFVLQGSFGKAEGYRRVAIEDVRPGDFVYFKFPYAGAAGDICDHVGVYIGGGKTVEGNTSAGDAGSQSNGGGVFVRTRPKSQWVGVVRPPYKR
jgi:hypothetical protein